MNSNTINNKRGYGYGSNNNNYYNNNNNKYQNNNYTDNSLTRTNDTNSLMFDTSPISKKSNNNYNNSLTGINQEENPYLKNARLQQSPSPWQLKREKANRKKNSLLSSSSSSLFGKSDDDIFGGTFSDSEKIDDEFDEDEFANYRNFAFHNIKGKGINDYNYQPRYNRNRGNRESTKPPTFMTTFAVNKQKLNCSYLPKDNLQFIHTQAGKYRRNAIPNSEYDDYNSKPFFNNMYDNNFEDSHTEEPFGWNTKFSINKFNYGLDSNQNNQDFNPPRYGLFSRPRNNF